MEVLALLVQKLWKRLKFLKFNVKAIGHKLWNTSSLKGLVIRKYDTTISHGSQVMNNIKVFVFRRHYNNDNSPPEIRFSELKLFQEKIKKFKMTRFFK